MRNIINIPTGGDEDIFNDLNAARALLAAMIFRGVENERKRPLEKNPPAFFLYASHYISVLIGRQLLAEKTLRLSEITHRNFHEIRLFLKFTIFIKNIEFFK